MVDSKILLGAGSALLAWTYRKRLWSAWGRSMQRGRRR